jgi:hypothetical protein
VTVSTTNPPVGGTITISGSGFPANDTLVITLHTKTYTLGTTTTDSSGSYSVTVKLPDGVSGKHTITVEDPATHKKAKIRITIGSAHGAAGAATSDSSSGGLSSTGVAVMGIGALGVVLLVGGGLMMLAGRRRKIAA